MTSVMSIELLTSVMTSPEEMLEIDLHYSSKLIGLRTTYTKEFV